MRCDVLGDTRASEDDTLSRTTSMEATPTTSLSTDGARMSGSSPTVLLVPSNGGCVIAPHSCWSSTPPV